MLFLFLSLSLLQMALPLLSSLRSLRSLLRLCWFMLHWRHSHSPGKHKKPLTLLPRDREKEKKKNITAAWKLIWVTHLPSLAGMHMMCKLLSEYIKWCCSSHSRHYHTHSKVMKYSLEIQPLHRKKNNFTSFLSDTTASSLHIYRDSMLSARSSACPRHCISVKLISLDMKARWANNLPNLFISRYNSVLCYIRPQMRNTICTY